MSQDGSHGHQGTDASSDSGSPPPATTDTATSLSQGESSNSGSWTGLPVAEDAGKGKEPAPAGSSLSKGKSPAAEVAAATTDDNVSKGKRKVGARDSMGAGGGRRNLLPHKLIERERRKRMNILYGELQALLPDIPEKKADKATVLGEAISFIGVLEGTVANLEKRKQDLALSRRAASSSSSSAPAPLSTGVYSDDLPQGWAWLPKQKEQKPAAAPVGFQSWSGANVVLSVSMDDAYISVCAPTRRPGVMVMLLSVLQNHRIDVVTAQVSSDAGRTLFSIYTRVNAEAVKKLGGEPPASEDIYKLAVSEIMVRLST